MVVVPKSYADEIRTALVDTCGIKMRLVFESIPDAEEWGTAQTLRHVCRRIPVSKTVPSIS